MIIVDNVHKCYETNESPEKWILKGVSFTIPAKVSVGVLGHSGAGKTTLLRLIGGIDTVTEGTIKWHSRVSWPMGFAGGLQNSLTGRQNARFICRIHGHTDELEERLAYIQDFSELGVAFDKPIKSYSVNMKQQLLFSLFIASDFDVYLSDVGIAAGADKTFKNKAIEAFKKLIDNSGLIMVGNEITLKQFCSAGIWLHEGQAYWFDDIDDALKHYKESVTI
jgi:capsular polysaccharide transport system ATP-binding protein